MINSEKVLNNIGVRRKVDLSSIQMSFPFERDEKPRKLVKKQPVNPARKAVNPVSRSNSTLPMALPLRKVFEPEKIRRLESRIQAHMNGTLVITVTDNRSSIISVKRIAGKYEVRLHHMFLNAPFRVVMALGRYIEKADGPSGIILENFIESNSSMIKETLPSKKSPRMETRGKYFDLQEIYNSLNKKYFDNTIKASITWGKPLGRTSRHHQSAKMGTYSLEEKIIRIHRALDRDFIPIYFIESIVYHEMLHQKYGVDESTGKRLFHPPAFNEEEKKFDFYKQARMWEQKNVTALLYF
ncbi:MAG: hypothetical protein JXR95_13260 [Deltaproteobacteria bacterium]|nr:hypothetical protein [Deltaproteobacteria bacterium]